MSETITYKTWEGFERIFKVLLDLPKISLYYDYPQNMAFESKSEKNK